MQPKITAAQFQALQAEQMPFADLFGLSLEEIRTDGVLMRARYDDRFLRPGGTISGPVMMALADAAMYALVLSHIGMVELAVTTNLNINFLRKPSPGDVLAFAKLLKLGKRLAVGDVVLYSEDESPAKPVAHVTSSYSIPPITHST
ncbi:MAG: PaaI family thioesterase [Gammaproteobacteria bacterium]|nr:PaaI family thioesterase [Gammaproteobacteria bacterium]